jgi:hypothetical protein
MAMEGRMTPAGIRRPKVIEERRIPKREERRRRRTEWRLPPLRHRPKKSSEVGEHSWKRFATSSEDWGLGEKLVGVSGLRVIRHEESKGWVGKGKEDMKDMMKRIGK